MKAPKLSKSSKTANTSSPASPDHTFVTSFDELRRPENRQLLRRQLTGLFPESHEHEHGYAAAAAAEPTSHKASLSPSSSSSAAATANTRVRHPLSRTTTSTNTPDQLSPVKSSSSSSIISNVRRRIPTIKEPDGGGGAGDGGGDDGPLDVESAITLLQELKKNASPEQLVALHKALLPTRENQAAAASAVPVNDKRASTISPGTNAATSPVPPARSRSMQPAGLATRGGPGSDPLRSQLEASSPSPSSSSPPSATFKPSRSPHRERADQWSSSIASAKTRPATVDITAETDALAKQMDRAMTPIGNEYSQIGTYGPGTLRVTNGAATPDPAPSLKSFDLSPEFWRRREKMPREETVEATSGNVGGVNSSTSSSTSSRNSNRPAQVHNQTAATFVGGLTDNAASTSSSSLGPRPQSRSTAQEPLWTTGWAKQASVEQGGGDVPRFAQRWSHRLSHIQSEDTSSSDDDGKNRRASTTMTTMTTTTTKKKTMTTTTTATATATAAAATTTTSSSARTHKLSPVIDQEDPEEDEMKRRKSTKSGPRLAATTTKEELSARLKRLALEQNGDGMRHATTNAASSQHSNLIGGRSPPEKLDSGYGSDNSFPDAAKRSVNVGRIIEQLREKDETVNNNGKDDGDDDDTSIDEDINIDPSAEDIKSAHVLQDILKKPGPTKGSYAANATAPLPPPLSQVAQTEKKSRTLLSLGSIRKSSAGGKGTDAVAKNAAAVESKAAAEAAADAKRQKKLQKSMPEPVKKAKRAEKKKAKEQEKEQRLQNSTVASPDLSSSQLAAPAGPERPTSALSGINLPIPVESDKSSGDATAPTTTSTGAFTAPVTPYAIDEAIPSPASDTISPLTRRSSVSALRSTRSVSVRQPSTAANDHRAPGANPARPGLGQKFGKTSSHVTREFRLMSNVSSDSSDRSRSSNEEAVTPFFTPELGPVANPLGSNPPSPPPQAAARTTRPGLAQNRTQSTPQGGSSHYSRPSSAFARSKSGGLVGLQAIEASEELLTRSQHQDLPTAAAATATALATTNQGAEIPRPRTAGPAGPRGLRAERPRLVTMRPTTVVQGEGIAGPGIGQPLSGALSVPSSDERMQRVGVRPHSVFMENKPGNMSELPAGEESRAAGDGTTAADVEGKARRMSDKPRADFRDFDDDPDVPIAEVIRKAVAKRRAVEARQREEAKGAQVMEARSVEIKKVHGPMLSVDGGFIQRAESPDSVLIPGTGRGRERASTLKERPPSGMSNLDAQASPWRDRRQSVGKLPSEAIETDEGQLQVWVPQLDPMTAGGVGFGQQPSPTNVISPYLAPFISEDDARRGAQWRASDASIRHAASYAALIGEVNDGEAILNNVASTNNDLRFHNRPFDRNTIYARTYATVFEHEKDFRQRSLCHGTTHNLRRIDSASNLVSVQQFPSNERPPQLFLPHLDNLYSSNIPGLKAYDPASPPIIRDRSPGGRVRTPSGHFDAHRPRTAGPKLEHHPSSGSGSSVSPTTMSSWPLKSGGNGHHAGSQSVPDFPRPKSAHHTQQNHSYGGQHGGGGSGSGYPQIPASRSNGRIGNGYGSSSSSSISSAAGRSAAGDGNANRGRFEGDSKRTSVHPLPSLHHLRLQQHLHAQYRASQQNFPSQSPSWSKHHGSGESGSGSRSRSTSPSKRSSDSGRSQQQKGADSSLLDRYGGGLQYGYERGSGIGGSAGTRASVDYSAAARKSEKLSVDMGLDLSDVPVFLRKL